MKLTHYTLKHSVTGPSDTAMSKRRQDSPGKHIWETRAQPLQRTAHAETQAQNIHGRSWSLRLSGHVHTSSPTIPADNCDSGSTEFSHVLGGALTPDHLE